MPARGTRRQPAPRPPRPVHGPRRSLAPAHSTSHDARSFAPKRTPLAAARWERARGAAGHRFRHTTLGSGSTGSGSESTRRCRTKPATSSAAAVPQHRGRQLQRTAATTTATGAALRTRRRAESSRLLRWFQHAMETGTASSGARGGHRQPIYGERQKVGQGGDRDRTAPPTAHSSGGRARRATHSGPDRQRRRQQSRAPRPGPATEATGFPSPLQEGV